MSDDAKIPDLYAEQDALGELPPDCDAAIRAKLEAEPQRATRVSDLLDSNEEILSAHPPAQMASQIQKRHEQMAQRPRQGAALRLALAGVPATVLLVVAAFLIWPGTDQPVGPETGPDVVRYKGDPRLVIQRRLPSGHEELKSGNVARAGDELLVGYLAEHAVHGVIVSVDGRGQATLHFPEKAAGSTALEKGNVVYPPFAYKLDDAPDFERFFFVTSDSPLDVEQILGAARNLGTDSKKPLGLPAGLRQIEFLLKK
jgi:hypothetical protein